MPRSFLLTNNRYNRTTPALFQGKPTALNGLNWVETEKIEWLASMCSMIPSPTTAVKQIQEYRTLLSLAKLYQATSMYEAKKALVNTDYSPDSPEEMEAEPVDLSLSKPDNTTADQEEDGLLISHHKLLNNSPVKVIRPVPIRLARSAAFSLGVENQVAVSNQETLIPEVTLRLPHITSPESTTENSEEITTDEEINVEDKGDGQHDCPECGKRYSTSSNLARHRQVHRSMDDRKARVCPQCNKVYVSMPAFSMHVRTHSQCCECKICGKSFSRPWLLQGHLRTHTGEKPFACNKCGKSFADKSNLRAHVQTHSTEKPFECKKCGKTFALKSYLYKHEEASCSKGSRRRSAKHGNNC